MNRRHTRNLFSLLKRLFKKVWLDRGLPKLYRQTDRDKLQEARRAETASDPTRWINSSGLNPPK